MFNVVVDKATHSPKVVSTENSKESAIKKADWLYDAWKLLNKAELSKSVVQVRVESAGKTVYTCGSI